MSRILIIEDDAAFAAGLRDTLEDFGHEPHVARCGEEALARWDDVRPALVFLDLRLGAGMDGIAVLRRLREDEDHPPPVVILTAFADGANTIEAMRLGAFDHLSKPLGREDIRTVVERALARPRVAPATAGPASDDPGTLLGSSPAMRQVQKLVGLAAAGDETVLILGETGTGKEVVANAIHRHGPRARRPFVAVNCAAIPAELLESELFGHVRGAFTGALQPRAGKFREAEGGTLFLDEIGDMTAPMQAKMLRALQDRAITPVGGSGAVRVDVRILAATHRDLVSLVEEGRFREDLFYRLNVLRIELPPLRERGSDILLLAERFLERAAAPAPPKRLAADAAQSLLARPWRGNVRELENLMRRASRVVPGPVITAADLGDSPAPSTPSAGAEDLFSLPWHEAVAHLEQRLLRDALAACAGNRAEAARRLGIRRQLLYAKLKEHGMDSPASP